MSRRRRRRQQSPEEQLAEAKLELERAESALSYRKSQLAEAEGELAALSGPGGWFAAIVGKKAAYEADAVARITALKSEIVSLRKRLIEARQGLAKSEGSVKRHEGKRKEHEAELERLADRVRPNALHPLYADLKEVEARLQTSADELFTYDDALAACGGLLGAMAAVAIATGKVKSTAAADAFRDLPASSTLAFLRRREVHREAQNVPDSVARFNEACGRLGLKPLPIEVPDIGSGWDTLFVDNVVRDLHHLERVQRFARRIEDERELVRETMIWISQRRKEALAKQDALLAERRAVLERGIG